jgi:hypothetical protein
MYLLGVGKVTIKAILKDLIYKRSSPGRWACVAPLNMANEIDPGISNEASGTG